MIALIIAALSFALLSLSVVLLAALGVSVLKKLKTKKQSKLVAAQVKDLIRSAPTMKLSDFEEKGIDQDDVIVVEYDVEKDEIVGNKLNDVKKENVEKKISDVINQSGGVLVFE